jgi:ABC-type microcin C transport system duplicated ATPase subunit YejF
MLNLEENIRWWFFLEKIQWLDDHIIQTRRRMPPIRNIGQVVFQKDKSAYDTRMENFQIVVSSTTQFPIFG